MTNRERFVNILNFKPADRAPFIEPLNWWDKTIERWKGEGLDKSLNGREINAYFGFDPFYYVWYTAGPRAKNRPLGHLGKTGGADDYERLRQTIFPWPVINDALWTEIARLQKRGDGPVWLQIDGFFWLGREVFGIERNLYATYDEPDLVHRLYKDLLEWQLKVLDAICVYAVPDICTVAEDMSYKSGSMISKQTFDKFMAPYYAVLCKALKKRGVLSFVDTDGNIHELAKWFGALGIDGFIPCERQAGVDIVSIRREFPRMLFLGGFDKMAMDLGEAQIRAEFDRLRPVLLQGGYIPGPDHQTPPAVSLTDYRLYLSLLREFCEEAKSEV